MLCAIDVYFVTPVVMLVHKDWSQAWDLSVHKCVTHSIGFFVFSFLFAQKIKSCLYKMNPEAGPSLSTLYKGKKHQLDILW